MQGSVPSAWRSWHRGTPLRACPASASTTKGALTNGLKWIDHVQSIHQIKAFFAQVPLHEHALPLIFSRRLCWTTVIMSKLATFRPPTNENVVPPCAKSHVLKQSSGIQSSASFFDLGTSSCVATWWGVEQSCGGMGVMQNVPHLLASISAFVYIGTLGCGREMDRQCKDCHIWRSRIKPITKKRTRN